MKNNVEPPEQPPPRTFLNRFLVGLLVTAVPIVVLGVFFAAGVRIGPEANGAFFILAWWVAALYFLVSFIVMLGFFAQRQQPSRRQMAIGMLAGLAIGIVALGLTCFAGISGVY